MLPSGEMLTVRGVVWLTGCTICARTDDVPCEGSTGIFEKGNFGMFEGFPSENCLVFVISLAAG